MYEEQFSRNWYFIDENLQKLVKRTNLLFAGCGLNSRIAELAVRTGFERITIWDGDEVELSNLNRQSFTRSDIGMNKARATGRYLKSINEDVYIDVHDSNITFEDVGSLIKDNDFIVNTVDFGKLFFMITRKALEESKVAILPLNVGFGSFVIVFNEYNKILAEAEKTIEDDTQMFLWLQKNLSLELPNYINVEKLLNDRLRKGFDPQLGVTASQTASLVVVLIMKLIQNEEVNFFPQVNSIDMKLIK